jgi:hypothetical protein
MDAVALIVDIVRSRELNDRAAAQSAVVEAFRVSDEIVPFRQSLWPTVGDEFQAVFSGVEQALRATTVARLLLPPEVDCRFGLGLGDLRDIASEPGGPIQDGSAWWRAREAIDEAHRREDRSNPYLRSWFISHRPEPVVNSYLLLRDHTITGMGVRQRRVTAGMLLGRSQSDIAVREGISQSAVSQSLRRSGGAAILAADRLLEEVP